jgi:hypothetical protein
VCLRFKVLSKQSLDIAVGHTFLLDAGHWAIQGYWLERNRPPVVVQGKTLVTWSQDDWLTMSTRLTFPDQDSPELTMQYRGKIRPDDQRYTFVMQHSQLGRIEGEGWIGPISIIQRYWVMGDRQKRTGLENLRWLTDNRYCFTSSIMAGNTLISSMEATCDRLLG